MFLRSLQCLFRFNIGHQKSSENPNRRQVHADYMVPLEIDLKLLIETLLRVCLKIVVLVICVY